MIQGRNGVPREKSAAKNSGLSHRALAVAVIGGFAAGGACCALLALFAPKVRKMLPLNAEKRAVTAASVSHANSVPAAVTNPALPSSAALLLGATDSVPIVFFHDITTDKKSWADLTPTEFEGQMRDLENAGAHPVSIQDFYDHFNTGKALPARPILLTFDECTPGQFENALPVLIKYKFPAAFFAPTDSIGSPLSPPHAGWQQLKKAQETGLITIGSQTVAKPQNLTNVSDEALAAELQISRKTLEEKLGQPVRFLAYPNGHGDARTAKAAQDAGYLAALTMDRGWAGTAVQSYFLPRFAPPRLPEVLACWKQQADIAPPPSRYLPIENPPLTRGTFKDGRYAVEWVAGGDLGTQTLHERRTVGEMAAEANVQAALNGAFFSEIRLRTIGSAMMGPTLCRAENQYSPATLDEDARLEGRPLVLIGPQKCLVLPYAEHLGHSREVLEHLMPDVTDAFLAGGWIVHQGKAVSPDTLLTWSSKDVNDARHRVFAGIDGKRRFILGGTQDGLSTAQLSKILQRMGLEEAWLMDSGYSSSLVWRNKVLISGHNDRATPSRPVPHALYLYGDLAPDAPPPPADALPASGPGAATTAEAFAADMGRRHGKNGKKRTGTRKRRRHRAAPAASSPAADSPPASEPSPAPAPETAAPPAGQ